MSELSAVLITKNGERRLRECLESLRFCKEIVVLDGGSTDATHAICAQFGARVTVSREWPGFGPQKNRAIALAKENWILSIDSDEVVTPELRVAIEAAMRDPGAHSAFEMSRLSSFCGHWMRHGGWWPDRVTRLFRAGRARFSDNLVHEHLIVDGSTGRLDAHLLHYTYDSLEQALEKQARYAATGAEQAFAQGRRAGALAPPLRAAWAFVRTYLIRAGFLDGAAGLQLARYNARTTYLRYAKLAELSRG